MKEVSRAIKDFFKKSDIFLLGMCLLCTAIGMVLISSAARSLSIGAASYLYKQALACALGIIVFVLFTLIDVAVYARFWKVLAVFNVVFIGILRIWGQGQGNKSWLRYSFLPFDIQPAEVIKISFVILMAWHMYVLKDRINQILPMLSLLAHMGVMVGVILWASRDAGVALIYVFAFFCMAIGAGVKPRWFAAAGALIGAALPIFWTWSNDTIKQRIIYSFSPESDPLGYGYHALQSQQAFVNGGLTGMGLYQGSQTQRNRIPEQQTDFIFTVAGEELGFFACVVIIVLLLAIVVRCLYMSAKAQNGYGALICIGIAGVLMFQMFENIGMCIGLTPIIGVTLPFFSYGGTSLLSMFAAMGVVSSIKMRPYPRWIRDRGL